MPKATARWKASGFYVLPCGTKKQKDRSASQRGLRVGTRPRLPRSRSRPRLRRGIYAAHSRDGHSRQTDSAAIAVAERLCRTIDRLDQTRVPRSCDRLRQTTSASSAAFVPAVLQRHPNTSVAGQGLTGAKSRPCHWEHSSVAHPRRIASPLCPDLICDMDRGHSR